MKSRKGVTDGQPSRLTSGYQFAILAGMNPRTEKRRAYMAEYYRKNKEKMDSQSSSWRKANLEKAREYVRKYEKNNPEKEKERRLRYRTQNRELLNEKNKERRRKDPEKAKEIDRRCKKNNPETVLRAYAKRKSYGNLNLPKGLVAKMLAEQLGLCAICQTDITEKYHVDHAEPLSKGGPHREDNLQLLCVSCNCAKGAKDFLVFLSERLAGK